MTDYIDKEDLLNDMCEELCGTIYDGVCENCRVVALIADTQAADVAPVQHGRWIEYETSAYGGVEDGEPKWLKRRFFRCSECRKGSAVKSTYCPNCGALMQDSDA